MTQRGRSMLPLTLLAVPSLLACGCGGGNDDDGAPAESVVVGSVSLPEDGGGSCAVIALDDDASGSNSVARRADGGYLVSFRVISGQSASFSFDDVPARSYYLWAFVDIDSSDSDPSGSCEITGAPTPGDHFGYYDTGLSPPSGPRVSIPHAEGLTFDFDLAVLP
jgi:hypothetical protein